MVFMTSCHPGIPARVPATNPAEWLEDDEAAARSDIPKRKAV
ncbi:MAG: hypothetical protein QM765_40835 [Myxococcales bacterium]